MKKEILLGMLVALQTAPIFANQKDEFLPNKKQKNFNNLPETTVV